MLAAVLFAAAAATAAPAVVADPPKECGQCAAWNEAQAPARLHGDSWYVGTAGLSAVVVRTPQGLVLLDGGLPQSAPVIVANLRTLGLDVADVRWLLNSHPHYDHAGGLAALQRMSGATVVSSVRGAEALRAGNIPADDAQSGFGPAANAFPPVADVIALQDGDTVTLGSIVFTMHATPGHTPGGTTWSWRSCTTENDCVDLVYADSLTAVSAPGYRFRDHPEHIATLESTFATIEALDCDLVVSAHPSASGLFEKLAARDAGQPTPALIDPNTCKSYAQFARDFLAKRLAGETD